jgi:hypothetical protein
MTDQKKPRRANAAAGVCPGRSERHREAFQHSPEFTTCADPLPLTAAFARPTPAEAAELWRRFSPDELLELARKPSMWNLTLAAIRHGAMVLDSHRNDPPAPPELPHGYIAAALRGEARAVLSAPSHRRRDRLRQARRNLDRLVLRGLDGAELDELIDNLEARL